MNESRDQSMYLETSHWTGGQQQWESLGIDKTYTWHGAEAKLKSWIQIFGLKCSSFIKDREETVVERVLFLALPRPSSLQLPSGYWITNCLFKFLTASPPVWSRRRALLWQPNGKGGHPRGIQPPCLPIEGLLQ